MPSNQQGSPDDLLVGGQALIEGVMMRAPGAYGIAVRRPDGTIHRESAKIASLAARYPWVKLPLVRGIAVLFQSLGIGIRALNVSAAVATVGATSETAATAAPEAADASGSPEGSPKSAELSGGAVAGSMVVGLALGIAVFLLLPLWLTQLAERFLFGPLSSLAFNLVDGVLRAVFFLGYIVAISRFKDIHRVFQYHGAEHKVVFNHEARLPLTVPNARAQSRLHPRCGTSFLLFVLLVSIFLFALIPKSTPFLLKFGGRLLLVPVVAGLSYEVLRLSARRRAAPLFAAIVWPGLQLQRITTQEPTDDMLEVAIVALEDALEADRRAAALTADGRAVAPEADLAREPEREPEVAAASA